MLFLLLYSFLVYRAKHPQGAYNGFSKMCPELFPNLYGIKPESYWVNRRGFTLKNGIWGILKPARSKYFTHIILWRIGGTRGGSNRARLIDALNTFPQNAHQLSQELNLDYSTIRHHLEALEKNGLVTSLGDGYGVMYFLSEDLLDNYSFFEKIWVRIGNKKKKSGVDKD